MPTVPAHHYALPCEPERLRSALSNALGGEVHVLYFSDPPWGLCTRQQDEDLGSALSREPLLKLVAELEDGQAVSPARTRLPGVPPARHVRQFRCSGGGQAVRRLSQQVLRPAAARDSWRWEKGGDADGWTSLPVQRPTYTYTPTVADVGHRLRASVYYNVLHGAPRHPSKSDYRAVRTRTVGPPEIVLAPPGSEDGRGAAGASEADRGNRSRYDVYLHGNRLIYRNRSCRREDEYGTRFSLIVYSLDSESGTPERDTLKFVCMCLPGRTTAPASLSASFPTRTSLASEPDRLTATGTSFGKRSTGSRRAGGGLTALLASATSGEPAARGVFDIHLGAGSLIFVKEPCARADTEAVFFLHLIPAQMADLPRPSPAIRLRQPGLRFRPARREIQRRMPGESPSPGIPYLRNQDRPVRPRGRRFRSIMEGGAPHPRLFRECRRYRPLAGSSRNSSRKPPFNFNRSRTEKHLRTSDSKVLGVVVRIVLPLVLQECLEHLIVPPDELQDAGRVQASQPADEQRQMECSPRPSDDEPKPG